MTSIIGKKVINIELNARVHFKRSYAAAKELSAWFDQFVVLSHRRVTEAKISEKEVLRDLQKESECSIKQIIAGIRELAKTIGADSQFHGIGKKHPSDSELDMAQKITETQNLLVLILNVFTQIAKNPRQVGYSADGVKIDLNQVIAHLNYEENLIKVLIREERQRLGDIFLDEKKDQITAAIRKFLPSFAKVIVVNRDELDPARSFDLDSPAHTQIEFRVVLGGEFLHGEVGYSAHKGCFEFLIREAEHGVQVTESSDDFSQFLSLLQLTVKHMHHDWKSSAATTLNQKRAA